MNGEPEEMPAIEIVTLPVVGGMPAPEMIVFPPAGIEMEILQ